MKRLQFSLFTLFVLTTLCAAGLAIWMRAETQRRAVSVLRSLEICEVYYDLYPPGMHPELAGRLNNAPAQKPCWLVEWLGIDVFHGASKVMLPAEHFDFALPHLKRLSSLQEIYVFDHGHDDEFQTRDERIQGIIEQLRREFPGVHVEECISHGLFISTIPVVG